MDRHPTHSPKNSTILHGDSIDPKTVRFTQLRDLIMALPDFDDDPARCGERILEAVQQAWIEETE